METCPACLDDFCFSSIELDDRVFELKDFYFNCPKCKAELHFYSSENLGRDLIIQSTEQRYV